MSQTINISITPASLTRAIRDINIFQTRKSAAVLKEINRTIVLVNNDAKLRFAGRRSLSDEKARRAGIVTAGDAPSSKGLRPHTRQGVLKASVHPEFASSINMEGAVFTNTKYAQFVEFGTRNARPHPYMVPALEGNRRSHIARITKALRKKL